ncbi:MAG: hypothetical protein KAT16_11270, partial [Candidatus Heimdallarchaeota archaeon]|nr:hypothetical protein [Candidatus Heimdallarchaeota archaeon]
MNYLIEDEALARIIELRQHSKFNEIVGNILENGSWAGLLNQIKRIEEKPEAVSGWEMPLRAGVIRDALIDLLSLQRLNGLDGNLLEIFNKLDADNLEELRLHAETHTHQLLETQIRK